MSIDKLESMKDAHPAGSSYYYGSNGAWGIAAFKHRDSDILCDSNWDATVARLAKVDRPDFEDEDGNVGDTTEEESSCSLVGWRRYLLVRPGSTAEVEALKIQHELEAYPILDEDDFGSKEQDYCDERWDDMMARERYDMVERALTDEMWEELVPNEGRRTENEEDMTAKDDLEFETFWNSAAWETLNAHNGYALREALLP